MNLRYRTLAIVALLIILPALALAVVPTVKVVPVDPLDASVPHDTYAGKLITLKGTTNVSGANFKATWDFGDGSPVAVIDPIGDPYNVGATHTYAGAVGTVFTATLTVQDKTTAESAFKNYGIVMRDGTLLKVKVNVAIDEGLWYLHKNLRRYNIGMDAAGDWYGGCSACMYPEWYYTQNALTASNLQAFEVNGHLEGGDPIRQDDPYTETVKRGLKYLFSALTTGAPSAPWSPPSGGVITPDSNGNGIAVYPNLSRQFYEGGMIMDAIAATGTPNILTTTGPAGVVGRKYIDVLTDMLDGYVNCQYRGSGVGGGWRYSCQEWPDNSAAQWGGIGILGAVRSFGIPLPAPVKNWNAVWVNYSQAGGGYFGYTGSGPIWGPFATTPSGMVQMSMDGIGRGDPRWDKAESYMRDNFANPASWGYGSSPKAYMYGLFSFTKSMLLHAPLGVLTPITLLKSSTGGVNPIDWYGAERDMSLPESVNNTDGVAKTLVNYQTAGGYWSGHNADGRQYPFETGWALIMLRREVFISCVSNLYGRGTPGRTGMPARVDLTWSGQTGAVGYDVLRGTALGGPYLPIGSTASTAYSDTAGLSNGGTYYYVLQPKNVSGGEICQSNEAKVIIPAGR